MLTIYLSAIRDSREKSRFRLFYEKYKGLVWYVASQMTKNTAEAEDIVHDVFLRLIPRFDSIRTDNEKETASLVYTVSRYCAADYLRKNRKEILLDDIAEEIDETEVDADFMIDAVYINDIMKSISAMDPAYAIPLQMKADGYSVKEIGVFLGITERNAKVRIHRARKILKQEMGWKDD